MTKEEFIERLKTRVSEPLQQQLGPMAHARLECDTDSRALCGLRRSAEPEPVWKCPLRREGEGT
jgi:hypothetical protein